MADSDANPSIANTLFPPPPPFFQDFTDENLTRRDALEGEVTEGDAAELSELQQKLQPPRADWIVEEGRWMCFGEALQTSPRIPTAADIGLPPFTDPSQPPQETMPTLLHSFLHTLLALLDVLTSTARIPGELEEKGWAHEGDQYIQHLTNLAATMMVQTNQLRSVQAEATLVMMMERQLAERQAQTAILRSKCEAISSSLRQLRGGRASGS